MSGHQTPDGRQRVRMAAVKDEENSRFASIEGHEPI
jgi:hypothetical protein